MLPMYTVTKMICYVPDEDRIIEIKVNSLWWVHAQLGDCQTEILDTVDTLKYIKKQRNSLVILDKWSE